MDLFTKSPQCQKGRIREEFTEPHGFKNGMEILRVVMNEEYKDTAFQRLSLGETNNRTNKIILLVGASGVGKTTCINAMVNYIFGVNFSDPFRFMVVDNKDDSKKSEAESQTGQITAYVFNHLPGMPFEYNYILIDTPGFHDTHVKQQDQELVGHLKTFFCSDFGVDHVDCIALVVPSPLSKLTETQNYIFQSISSLFGKDVRNNIMVMATFADDGPPLFTPALEAADVTYVGVYKFNNSSLYANNSSPDQVGGLYRYNWTVNTENMSEFFLQFTTMFPVSLNLTKEVLRSRIELQSCLAALDSLIHIGLDKMITLEKEKAMLAQVETNLKDCENYAKEIEVPRFRRYEESRNHFHLALSIDLEAILKAIIGVFVKSAKVLTSLFTACKPNSGMNQSNAIKLEIDYGNERKLPNLSLEDYGYGYMKEERTIKQLMDRYRSNKMEKDLLIEAIKKDIDHLRSQLYRLVGMVQSYEQMLKNISLKQNASVKDYIDQLILMEKSQLSLHWEKRVEMLEDMKNHAGSFDIFTIGEGQNIGPNFEGQLIEFVELCI
ncbi:uncharacterized protein LOC143037413 isoform X2 [Oratosquilla oratoria]|uniref:uncharacterized protein LOC143037413 isoform X2 n=1 Tax=Oratosquilla oratoria TaxID=337810 RepID=UPI003F76E73E